MLQNAQRDVEKFHRTAGSQVGDQADPELRDVALRLALIREEVEELARAVEAGDLVAAVDALVDILYVTIGSAVTWGVDLGPAWDEVQRSNMAKFPGGVVHRRADGKILKPVGWKPPQIREVLDKQVGSHRSIRAYVARVHGRELP